ncbi:TetR/AcrR family transcriptional regulator [Blautia sp. RD014234]|nr:TetR/AcrR family transcriptional regulator [Blautia parvula]MCA5963891.1 TetR/AcrR family transcriptional regulator [Blautia parvula]
MLNTARKHFLKDGLTGASLRNIVKDAGLTTGAFYKYYPTKEALFDALTDPYMEHIYQIYDRSLRSLKSFRPAIRQGICRIHPVMEWSRWLIIFTIIMIISDYC